MDALEAALSESGLALVHKPTGYLLTTMASAGAAPTGIEIGAKNAAGYGASLVTVEHASPTQLVQLAEPLHRQTSHDDPQ